MVAADGSQSELCSPIPSDPLDQPVSNGIPVDVVTLSQRIIENAEMKIPECREKLLDAKNKMSDTADMYQKDYIDRVEDRQTLTDEAKNNAVMCLIDVSQKIYNLAECFQKLLEDQSDKLVEIETMTLTASASLEIASCREFRDNLKTWISKDNTPGRKPRIGRPETMVTEYTSKGVEWEKLDYSKYDRIGEGGVQVDEEIGPIYSTSQAISQLTGNNPAPAVATMSRTSSQQSLKSQESAKNLTTSSTSLQSVNAAPVSPGLGTLGRDGLKLREQGARLSLSAADVRTEQAQALHYGSMTSLSSMVSTKSLKIAPARPAPAPPPAKTKVRGRVYSVKNETGDGLEKPSIPPPMPPPQPVEEEHYAIPPNSRMPTLNEEMLPANTSYTEDEVLYDQVRGKGASSPQISQYQQIAIQPPPTSNKEPTDELTDVLTDRFNNTKLTDPSSDTSTDKDDTTDDMTDADITDWIFRVDPAPKPHRASFIRRPKSTQGFTSSKSALENPSRTRHVSLTSPRKDKPLSRTKSSNSLSRVLLRRNHTTSAVTINDNKSSQESVTSDQLSVTDLDYEQDFMARCFTSKLDRRSSLYSVHSLHLPEFD